MKNIIYLVAIISFIILIEMEVPKTDDYVQQHHQQIININNEYFETEEFNIPRIREIIRTHAPIDKIVCMMEEISRSVMVLFGVSIVHVVLENNKQYARGTISNKCSEMVLTNTGSNSIIIEQTFERRDKETVYFERWGNELWMRKEVKRMNTGKRLLK